MRNNQGALEIGARFLTLGLGGVELIAGMCLAVFVVMISDTSPHPIGAALLIALSGVAIILPATAVGAALFSERKSAAYGSLAAVIIFPSVLISTYLVYA